MLLQIVSRTRQIHGRSINLVFSVCIVSYGSSFPTPSVCILSFRVPGLKDSKIHRSSQFRDPSFGISKKKKLETKMEDGFCKLFHSKHRRFNLSNEHYWFTTVKPERSTKELKSKMEDGCFALKTALRDKLRQLLENQTSQ